MKHSSRSYRLLVVIHILAAVSVVGADLAMLSLGVAGLRGAEPQTVYPAASLVSAWVAAPLAVVTLISGVLLARVGSWGLTRYWWTTIKLTITLLLTGLLVFGLVPRLRASAEAAVGPTSQAFGTAERIPLVLAPTLATTLLMLAVALAVFKPGWRLRGDRLAGGS